MGAPSTPAISIDRAAELSGSTPASIKRAKPIVQSGIPGGAGVTGRYLALRDVNGEKVDSRRPIPAG